MSNEDNLRAQKDELDALHAIFPDDVILRQDKRDNNEEYISYSIRLETDDDNHDLQLKIFYPQSYPESAIPIFDVGYGENNLRKLHLVQKEALLNIAIRTAQSELGMPSVFSCINAVKQFIYDDGLTQAGIALLSDDCLAFVMQYAVSTKEDVDKICSALPICKSASKSNSLWQQLCQIRWKTKFGYERRWNRAMKQFNERFDEEFWLNKYSAEERDSTRSKMRVKELSNLKFDMRQWFSMRDFRNQEVNMRDLLPSGLRQSIARDVVFSDDGTMKCSQQWTATRTWIVKDNAITWKAPSGSSVECFQINRLPDWSWELLGNDFILRAISDDFVIAKWHDLTSTIIIEEKCAWVSATRAPHEYQYREIPDVEHIKAMLDW